MKRSVVFLRWSTSLVLSLCGCLLSARAQATERGSWEIGMDLGAEFVSRDVRNFDFFGPEFLTEKEQVIEVPKPSVRVAYFLTPSFAIEPSFGFSTTVHDHPEEQLIDWDARVGVAALLVPLPQGVFSPFLASGFSVQSGSIGTGFFTFGDARFGIPILLGLRMRAGDAGVIRVQSGVVPTFNSSSKTAMVVPVQIGWSWLVTPTREGDSR